MYINELSINVVCKFKFYPNIVCDDNKTLWQLNYCPRKRTIPLRRLTYNSKRNAYRVNSIWVSRNRLLNLRIEKKYKIILQYGKENPF